MNWGSYSPESSLLALVLLSKYVIDDSKKTLADFTPSNLPQENWEDKQEPDTGV